MAGELPPQRRAGLTVAERIAVLEAAHAGFDARMVGFDARLVDLRDQREREHQQNQVILARIDRNSSAAADGVQRLDGRVGGLEHWRAGAEDQLNDVARMIRGNDQQPGLVAVFGWIAEVGAFTRVLRRAAKVAAATLAIVAPVAVIGATFRWW